MEWIAASLVIASLGLMALKRYEQGWWLSLFACLAWSIVAGQSDLWGLLLQSAILALISVKGIKGTHKP